MMGMMADKTFLRQHEQRFPHGTAADAELRRKSDLGQLLAGLELAREQSLPQQIQRALPD